MNSPQRLPLSIFSTALLALGCADSAASPDAATTRGPDVVIPSDRGVLAVDHGPPVSDAGCVYEPVTLDRNNEPRNAAGNIRWCWPGEARCTCDADDDCYREAGYIAQCATADVPRDAGNVVLDAAVTPPRDAGNPVPTDLGNSGTGLCSDPVSPTSAGPVLNLETLHFNWSMQCYRPEDGSLFVFVEDTETDMVALRFYDFLNDGGPATGDTLDLARTRAGTRPFFVSTLSGIVTAPTWSAQRSYLAYEGEVVFQQLQRTAPIGTRMRIEIRNLRAREVRQYTNGRCENIPDGGRMFVRSLILDLPVNNLHTDADCIDWAGG